MKVAIFSVLLTTAGIHARCPASVGPGEHLRTVTVGGVQRNFYVYVPQGLGTRESPGVMMIHGCGSSPMKFEMESQMNARAEQKAYYNVYPEGTYQGSGSPRLGWNAGFSQCATGGAVNDVDFTRATVLWMLENLCIDSSQIYASGFSNGGSMAFNLTCEMSDVFGGFAFTGSTQPPSTYPSSPTCGGGLRPEDIKPMLGLCGKLDGCGNTIESWFGEFSRFSTCAGNPRVNRVSSTSTCYKYTNCGANKNEPLEYCMVDDLGHCWSGNDCCDNNCLNQDAANMDFSTHILDFFTGVTPRADALNSTAMATKLRNQLAESERDVAAASAEQL